MHWEVIFDIETQKLFEDIDMSNIADLGVSIVSVYRRQLDQDFNEISGQIMSFWENELSQIWPLFSEADRIIGFNSLGFDIPVLQPHCQFNLKKLKHFDILEKIKNTLGFRLSLDALAKETLGKEKTDIGTNAVTYWQQHTPQSLDKLESYCQADVLITKEIYDFGLKNRFLKYKDKWNTPRIVEVDFSYPPPPAKQQIGLF